jgi:hypothetical protein
MKNNPLPPRPRHPRPTPNLKGKKTRQLECILGPPHWLHVNFLPKKVHHQFWPGLAWANAHWEEHPTYPITRLDTISYL